MDSINKILEREAELTKWKEYQAIGERSNNQEIVANAIVGQIECLYYLGQFDKARAFLDSIPGSIDLHQPRIREMLTDAYVMIDDVEYYFDWYKKNLFSSDANEGDQILVYGLLCHNRNNDAREVFERIFPTLSSAHHFKYALKHIAKIIGNHEQRALYYQSILDKSLNQVAATSERSEQSEWYEILLQVYYCLSEISGFEKTTHALTKTDPDTAKRHLDILARLLDITNSKWQENKIFGIGLSKTGTSSLSKALLLLNFSTAHWTNPYSHDLLSDDDMPLFDSLTDISITYKYKEIYSAYPDAKFILTTRAVVDWERSFLSHYARSMHATSFDDLREIILGQHPPRFGQKYVDMHKSLYFRYKNLPEAYHSHEQDVLNFFKGRKEQLLLLDVSKPNALQILAEFLKVETPQKNFPHVNKKEQKNTWISPITGETRSFKFGD